MVDQILNVLSALTFMLMVGFAIFAIGSAVVAQMKGRGTVRWDGLLFAGAVLVLALIAFREYPAAVMDAITDGIVKAQAVSPEFRQAVRSVIEPVANELGNGGSSGADIGVATPEWIPQPTAVPSIDPNVGGGAPDIVDIIPTPQPTPVPVEPTPVPPTPTPQPTPCVIEVGGKVLDCPPTPSPGG